MTKFKTKHKAHALRKTGAAALIIAAVLTLALLFTGCKQSTGSSGGGSSTVNITVKGDEHINLPSKPVAVLKGAKWAEVKSTVKSKVSTQTGFLIVSWHLGADESAPELKDTDVFVKDTTVFVKSRPDLPDLSSIQGSGEQVKITFAVTPAEGGAILGPNPISVNKNTPWAPLLKAYAEAALKVNYGFQCNGWKKDGNPVNDTYTFDGDTTVYAETVGSTVNITVTGDANVNVPSEPVAVRAGAKWAEAKSTVQGKVSPKPNFLIDTWHLGEDESAPELKDTDVFVKDTTVFVKSRANLPDLSPIQGSETQVKITFGVTPAGGGAILGPNPISVNKNTPWNPLLKDYAAAALKVSQGYELTGWKKNGTVLDDTFSFDDDANIFAELEDRRIYLTVTGDSHVTVNNPTETIVIKSGTKWQSIKENVAAKVTVNDPTNFDITAWHRGTGASDPVLTDDYEFKKEDGQNRTVYAETGDKRITVTVKYGKPGTKNPLTAGTITVYDGDTWSTVKPKAQNKLPSSALAYGATILKWQWNDADGWEISANHTFKVSDGATKTVYALIRPSIEYGPYFVARSLQFYAPESGTVIKRDYYLGKIYGATNGTLGHDGNADNPKHQVSLDAYWMAEREVTQQLYELVMGKNPSHFKGSLYPPASGEIQELRPVEQVNWYEAVAFCNELTRCCSTLEESDCVYTVEGHTYTVRDAKAQKVPSMDRSKKGFRLPTEAEWEWAAQGGIERLLYPAGEPIDDYIWYKSNSGSKTHQGFKKKRHPKFPLDDIGGNVDEWCWDWYGYPLPVNSTNYAGPTSGTSRIRRGGSCISIYYLCECSTRRNNSPEKKEKSTGFRIVCRD